MLQIGIRSALARALLAALLLAPALPALAGCALKFQLAFPDGSKGCLDEYPIVHIKPVGYSADLASAAHQKGYFVLATPRDPRQCPLALGFSKPIAANITPEGARSGPKSAAVRESQSLADCQRAAGVSTPGANCECVVIVTDGQVPLPKADFERIATEIESAK